MYIHSSLVDGGRPCPLQNGDNQQETNSRLDTVIRLLAAMYVRGLNNNDAIIKLDRLQLSREQIVEAVGVTAHNVSQVLYASKKAAAKKPKKANGRAVVREQVEVQQA